MTTPYVAVRNLRVQFPDAGAGVAVRAGTDGVVEAVAGISFEIAPGECLAIVGESGSGKTMTALALLGLVPSEARVSADELVVAGVDTDGFRDRDWRGIRGRLAGLVSQDALVSLDPLRRIGREVAEVIEMQESRVTRAEVGQRVIEALTLAAVPTPEFRARQYPHELSGGFRQRALIASAIAGRPGLLIADEPTTALDSTVQAQILQLLGELKESGLALLLVSHDLTVVERLADRIAVMKDGHIVETAPAATLLAWPSHPYTRLLLDAVPGPRDAPAREGGAVVLSGRALVKAYRQPDHSVLRAVNDVSLELRAGTTLGVVGESGSGKSTLARLLMAIESPDGGEVLLDGEAWSALPERDRRSRRGRIQLIDQDPFGSFDPRWSVRRILAEAVALEDSRDLSAPHSPAGRGRVASRRIRELLAQVGLSEELLRRRPHQLSGGQRQRVAIARALARRPEILVCDEPVSALDVSVQAQVLELLGSLQQGLGLSMVFISHDLAVIAQIGDDILVMKDGVVVERGRVAEIVARPAHPFTRALLAASNLI